MRSYLKSHLKAYAPRRRRARFGNGAPDCYIEATRPKWAEHTVMITAVEGDNRAGVLLSRAAQKGLVEWLMRKLT